MATAYFSKELPEQPIYIGGRGFKFDIIATEDNWLIGELRNAAGAGIGGVREIDEAQYETLKKNRQNEPLLPNNWQRQTEISAFQWQNERAVRHAPVVVGNRPPPTNLPPAEPISVPSPKVFLPKIGRLDEK